MYQKKTIGPTAKLINDTFHKLKKIKNRAQRFSIIVEHNLKTLLPLADFAYILKKDKIACSGKSKRSVLDKMM